MEDIELATLGCVHWHNTAPGYRGDRPPADYEQAQYAANRNDQTQVAIH